MIIKKDVKTQIFGRSTSQNKRPKYRKFEDLTVIYLIKNFDISVVKKIDKILFFGWQ